MVIGRADHREPARPSPYTPPSNFESETTLFHRARNFPEISTSRYRLSQLVLEPDSGYTYRAAKC